MFLKSHGGVIQIMGELRQYDNICGEAFNIVGDVGESKNCGGD